RRDRSGPTQGDEGQPRRRRAGHAARDPDVGIIRTVIGESLRHGTLVTAVDLDRPELVVKVPAAETGARVDDALTVGRPGHAAVAVMSRWRPGQLPAPRVRDIDDDDAS